MKIGKISNNNFAFCSVFSILLTGICSIWLIKIESNILFYIVLCAIFGITFLLSSYIYEFFIKNKKVSIFKEKILLITVIFLTFVFYVSDSLPINKWSISIGDLVWHSYFFVFFGILVFYLVVVFYVYKKFGESINDFLYYACLVVVVVISFLINYQIYNSDGYSFYHRHAYMYEIYKCYNAVPYSATTSGTYGHYGLFFMLPLRILGGCNLKNITLVICFSYSLMIVLLSRTIRKTTRNNFICIISIVMMLFPLTAQSNGALYYQLSFHRFFLAILFIANIINYKNDKKSKILFFISTIFALLWSNDIGFIFALCYLIFVIFEDICVDKQYAFKSIVKGIVLVLCAFVCALLVLNTYNLIVEGELLLLDFFYPYNLGFSSSLQFGFNQEEYAKYYLNDVLQEYSDTGLLNTFICNFIKLLISTNLEKMIISPVLYFYFWIIAFLLFISIYCLVNINRKFYIQILNLCIFGLGAIVYYINRPAYGNIYIIIPIIIVVLVLTYNYIFTRKYNLISIVLIVSLIDYAALISTPQTFNSIIANSNANSIKEIENYVTKNIPNDAYCFGIGAFEVCNDIGYKNISSFDDIHYVLSRETTTSLVQEMAKNKHILIFKCYDNRTWGNDVNSLVSKEYDLVDSYSNGIIQLEYYSK